jgi:hypothetical protein
MRKLRSFEYNQQPRRVRVRCSKRTSRRLRFPLSTVPHKQTSYSDRRRRRGTACCIYPGRPAVLRLHASVSVTATPPKNLGNQPGIKVRPSSFSKMPNRLSSVRRYARGKRGTCGRPHGLRLDHCTSTSTPTKALLCL